MTAGAQGFLDRVTEVGVQAGVGPIVLALARGALLTVTVRRADGARAGDACLRATLLAETGLRREDVEVREDCADDAGQLEWRLAAGRWRVSWVLDDVESVLGEWTLAEGEGKDLELTLPHR